MTGLPLLRIAQDLGFVEIGWTTGNSQGAKEAFLRWLAEGRHGPLAYMDTHKEIRLHPERLLEATAAGFLVVVLPLAKVETKATDLPSGHAYVSRYARGRDYHKVMRHRLVKLLDEIRLTQPNIQGRATVDSAPVLERDLAVQAGLGWIGKNSMFLTPKWGSHVLLGSLILSEKPAGLETKSPMGDHCGTCRACLEACPTGAIRDGELMDASKCIVCWSIEEQDLPDATKVTQWGPHFFGCDLCQDPCPWNRFADAPVEGHPLEPRLFLEAPSINAALERLLHDPESLLVGSALSRAGRRGLLRNALAASLSTDHEPPHGLLESLAEAGQEFREVVTWYRSLKGRLVEG